jgi:hypothetical protein
MNQHPGRCLAAIVAGASVVLVAACAIPATDVAVTTMPMQRALDIARSDSAPTLIARQDIAPLEKRTLPPSVQGAILSTPDVRLAYVYEWVDADGNRHYGEWVAIPVASSHWVMSDGTHAPIDLNPADTAPMPEIQ